MQSSQLQEDPWFAILTEDLIPFICLILQSIETSFTKEMPARPPCLPGHEFSKRPCPIAAIISLTLFLLKHTQQKTHLRKTLHSEEGVFSKGKKYSQIKFPQFHKNLQLPGSQCMLWDRAEVIYSLGYFLMSSSNSTQQWVNWLLTAYNIS